MIVDDEVRWIAQRAADGKDFSGSLLELANEAKRYKCLRQFSWLMLKKVDEFCRLEDMSFDSMIDRIRVMWPTHCWNEAWERLQKYVRKGFTACNGTLLSIAKAIQDTNLSDPEKNTLSFYPDGTPRFARFD